MPYSAFYFGDVGSGKTLMATIQAIIDHKLGRQIWSNIDFRFSHVHVSLKDLLMILTKNVDIGHEPRTLIIDETHTQADSRSSQSWINKHFSYFISQSRKMGFNVIYISQFLNGYDVRLRQLTQYVIQCQSLRDFNDKPIAFIYAVWSTQQARYTKRYVIPEYMASKFYKYYDTYQKIVPSEVELNQILEEAES